MTETEHDAPEPEHTAYGATGGKGRAGVFVFLVLLTLVAAAVLVTDWLSDEKAEYTEQLDPTTLDDAPD